jgi:hypothetical protein
LVRFSVRKTGVFSWALPQGHVLLALSFGEGQQGNLLLADELIDGGDEGLAHGLHEGGRSEGVAAMEAEEGGDAGLVLQLGLVDIEVHAVDAFDFQGHMVAEDFGDSPRYAHGWLRSSRSLADPSTALRLNRGCSQHTPL